MSNKWPNNRVYGVVPTKQRLGNKTLFTNIIDNGISQTRYFSGTDAEIYFDEIYIDEVVQIQFQMQQNTLPLFGYNSYVYDQVARGSRIINGSFTINFTKANYLYDVLNTLSNSITSSEKMIIKDPENTIDEFDKSTAKTENKTLYMGQPDGPILNKTFEIVLSYGDARQSNFANSSTMLTLTGVVLTGCSQVLGINGEPVYETYSFIARDMVSNIPSNNTTTKPKETISESTTDKHSDIAINSLTYTEEIDAATNRPYGVITMSYRSMAPIYEIKLQLNSVDIKTEMIAIATQGERVGPLSSNVSYRVSPEWREKIRKYCNDKILYTPNSLNVNADVMFAYQNLSTKIVSSKLKIGTVYTDKK